MLGLYLSVFAYWLDYPEWVGPLVMLAMLTILFVFPIPIYHKSRIWLSKICVRPARSMTQDIVVNEVFNYRVVSSLPPFSMSTSLISG